MDVKLFVYKPIRITAEDISADEAIDLLRYLERKGGKLTWHAVDVNTGMQLNMNNGEWKLKEQSNV